MTDLNQSTPERLEGFRVTLEAAQIEKLLRQGYGSHIETVRCKIKMGRKYANVDVGSSGKYMVELATSRIYGIKGYGVIHRSHYYGTLNTIGVYDWSGYTATPRKEAPTP
ncbi:hypothetical protein LCGC14_2491720 [marine sediment metagenome]|uniref:Uncharacterized protein n=1 Tax=marine sediment metagenome TaxID=412755 RepID=A0A0F9DYA7_9ZZZZ